MFGQVSLDRFSQGLPDRQQEPEVVVAECACGCRMEILDGYVHYKLHGLWFYDDECVLKYVGAARRTAR